MSNLRQAAQAVLECWDGPVPMPNATMISNLRTALAAPEQEPLGWMIEGAPTVMHGAFAELDAKAEAKRIGGTCKAYPVYREPVDIEAITKERDEYKDRMQKLMTTVSDLKSERDEYQQAADTMAAAHKIERDKHCNCEFEGDENTVQCTLHNAWAEALHEQAGFRRERDALMQAAKPALEALTEYASVFENASDPETPAGDAIEALKKAGVQ